MAAPEVVGLGESSIDYVHMLPELPGPQTSKLRIRRHFSSCGGQVATAMAACARLGLRAGYLGPVGVDDNGRRVLAELRWKGVDVSRAIVRETGTRFAIILVDERTGERNVLWYRDERLKVQDDELDEELFAGARILHVDGVDEDTSTAAARRARALGLLVTSDIDTVGPRTKELVSAVDVPILAEHVPRALTGCDDVEQALRALRREHAGLLVVTLGERGSAALDGERFLHVAAPHVHVIDTTGAGDVFRAGVIYGLLQGWTTDETLRFANTAAALGCTRRGAITAVPTIEEIQAALA